jgi:hypothetical protein
MRSLSSLMQCGNRTRTTRTSRDGRLWRSLPLHRAERVGLEPGGRPDGLAGNARDSNPRHLAVLLVSSEAP